MNNITFVKEKVNIETIKNDKILKLPQVPKLGPKLNKEFKKFDIKTIFTSGHNLKNLICRNMSKLLPNRFPGVYQLGVLAMPYILPKLKRKSLLEPQNTNKTVSTESGKAQALLSIAQNVMDSLIG